MQQCAAWTNVGFFFRTGQEYGGKWVGRGKISGKAVETSVFGTYGEENELKTRQPGLLREKKCRIPGF